MDQWLEQGYRAGIYGDLGFHFGRFLLEEDGRPEAEPLAVVAAFLAEQTLEGHVCLDLKALLGRAERPCLATLDTISLPSFETVREQILKSPVVSIPGRKKARVPLLVFEGDRLYLYRHYVDEITLAEAIQERLKSVPLVPPEVLRPHLDHLFEDPDQRSAAALACLRPFLVISGGPGSGKTTCVARLIRLLKTLKPELRIALAAPTGKAAARLTEALANAGLPSRAATIHRLLRLGRRDAFGPDHPLPVDLLIVDEASMVDLALAARLFRALRSETRVILVGDRHQLASVEAGSVLADLTGRGASPCYSHEVAGWLRSLGLEVTPREGLPIAASLVELRKNYRFSSERGIGRLAAAICRGDVETALTVLAEGDEELLWHDCAGEEAIEKALSWLETHHRPLFEAESVREALTAIERAQLLTVLREGPFGEGGIFRRFEKRLLLLGISALRGIEVGEVYPRLPISVTRNDYELELFNGDLGLVWEVDGKLRAFFRQGEGFRTFPVRQLPEWRKAWTLTVHKAQGSEFDEVALLLPDQENPLLTRELLYTAVTRARRRVVIFGSRDLLRSAVLQRSRRASGLAERLGWS